MKMELDRLSQIVSEIEHRCFNGQIPGYFDCLKALDELEFHVLDAVIRYDASNHEMKILKSRAMQLHDRLTAIAQGFVDKFAEDIRTGQMTSAVLRRQFNQYRRTVCDLHDEDRPEYDPLDDFLSDLFRVDVEPSESRPRTSEMVYLQPTPGRVILDMIHVLSLSDMDRFYDLGSGLGQVPLLVALLTDASAVGVEYEPTYVQYSRRATDKLGIKNVEFLNGDAQTVDLSDGTIFFMYTPFTGCMMRNVLDRIREVTTRQRIVLCTYGPCTLVIERETWLSPVRHIAGAVYQLAIFSSIVV